MHMELMQQTHANTCVSTKIIHTCKHAVCSHHQSLKPLLTQLDVLTSGWAASAVLPKEMTPAHHTVLHYLCCAERESENEHERSCAERERICDRGAEKRERDRVIGGYGQTDSQ